MIHAARSPVLFALLALASIFACASPERESSPVTSSPVTRQELLRGSVTAERAWWDLLHYDLDIQILPETRRLKGSNLIRFLTLEIGDRMQIDLQTPLRITRVAHGGEDLSFEREGDVYWISFASPLQSGVEDEVRIFYEGTPVASENPPWSGGVSWDFDDLGEPFIATTSQGIGASIWWPNKDHGYDEPDRGMDIHITVPDTLVAVANGRLQGQDHDAAAETRRYHWRVTSPINNYCVNVNIGDYLAIRGIYPGEDGPLDVDYWVLRHQEEVARRQFQEVPRTLAALEHWFGPYPFYADSYKLVTVPYLGMEHQSSVTYGNRFKNGYEGRDLSGTGVGMKFDFIVVHESAHEWFGNNVSMKDAADMWIHESFANYAENLFVEYHFTETEAQDYVIGCRKLIRNDRPIIGTYGANREGSGDMYYKGGNMLHTMRHVLDNDVTWREVLRGINREFHHQTITTGQLEAYISRASGFDFGPFFEQYLRTTDIPLLKYRSEDHAIILWWEDVVPDFAIPVVVRVNGAEHRVLVSEDPTQIELGAKLERFELDRNFYMRVDTRQ